MNMNAPQETPTLKPSRRFCVAPMMDRFHREREVSSDKGFQVSRKPVVH